jgi:hypothetical protein
MSLAPVAFMPAGECAGRRVRGMSAAPETICINAMRMSVRPASDALLLSYSSSLPGSSYCRKHFTPLMTSSYLDLTKNSSLAVAIGFPDFVSVANTTANTTGQVFEAITIIVAVCLTLNIGISILMNIYNQRVALKGGQRR